MGDSFDKLTENIEVDFDACMEYCESDATISCCEQIVTDLNKLCTQLRSLESHFHCGTIFNSDKSGNNAIIEIYEGFQKCIGSASACGTQAVEGGYGATATYPLTSTNGKGMAGCNTYAAWLFQVVYDEAVTDKERLTQSTDGYTNL